MTSPSLLDVPLRALPGQLMQSFIVVPPRQHPNGGAPRQLAHALRTYGLALACLVLVYCLVKG
jgi:hypothetical protein